MGINASFIHQSDCLLVLGLGSNVGDRMHHLRCAIKKLRATPALSVLRLSPVYLSDALLPEGAPEAWDKPYLNMAITCTLSCDMMTLLQRLKAIETEVGREMGGRWGPRVIDLDILAYGEAVIDTPALTIPHRGLCDRPFALWPLADLTPHWKYPVKGVHYGKTALALSAIWGSRFSKQAPYKTHQINASIESPALMAAVNITPDSFSDGGRWDTPLKVVRHVQQCLDEGAAVIDVGAESTRPGAALISPTQEWARLQPVLEAIKTHCRIPVLSIDTRHVEVARLAMDYGMTLLNDVSGCDDPCMRAWLASVPIDVIVMHHLGVPADRNKVIALHEDPVSVVYTFAQEKIAQLQASGIDRSRIIFDVGIGFGKTAEQSLSLLKNIALFHQLGVRLCVGHSRKSFMNVMTQKPYAERDIETAMISGLMVKHNVHYLRVHNVEINYRALNVCSLLE